MGKDKKVPPLNRNRLTANAFRVLGVPAGASQAEVEAAARKMRIWTEPADIPATPWDLPWLGELSRGRNEIEQALACLSEPESRIDQRLFWFAESAPPQTAPAAGTAGHDPALAELAGLMVGDENFQKIDRWGKALSGLREAAASPNYRDWFLNVERDGDFEKRADDAEIVAALAGMRDSIAQSVAARMRQFIDADDVAACLRLMKLLPAAGVEPPTATRIGADVCNRVEDMLVTRCTRLCDDLHRGLGKPVDGKWKNRRAAKRVRTDVEGEIKTLVDPLVEALGAIEGYGSDRMRRIGMPAARMMRNLWIGWSRAGKPQAARVAMRQAQRLAKGTPLEAQLLAEARPKPAATRNVVWWRFALPVVVMAITGLSHLFSDNPSTTSHPTAIWPPPAYRMPAPQPVQPFTPNPEAENPVLDRPTIDGPAPEPPTASQADPSKPAFPDTPLNFDQFVKKPSGGK